jgi:hypothetical protein
VAATDVVALILDAIVESLGNTYTTPVTGTGAPTNFREWTKADMAAAQDRHFEVVLVSMDEHGNTGVDTASAARVSAYLTCGVRMKFKNEGKPARVFHGYVAKDVRTIQDRVQYHLRNAQGTAVAGLAECFTNGAAVIERGEDPSVVYAFVPFRVEYTDTVKTS